MTREVKDRLAEWDRRIAIIEGSREVIDHYFSHAKEAVRIDGDLTRQAVANIDKARNGKARRQEVSVR